LEEEIQETKGRSQEEEQEKEGQIRRQEG